MLARSRGASRDGSCSRTRRQRRKEGNLVWPIKSRQTNKHTLLFYRYRLADHAEPCSATVPRQHRHENSLLLFPHSLPMSRPRASSYQAQTSWAAELAVPCNHFFYALSMIMDHAEPCSPALGSRKADIKTLSFFFPTPYPCHVARKQLSSPDIMGGRAACALQPFLLCPEHDNGWIRWRT